MKRCKDDEHTWQMVRIYTGVETFDVKLVVTVDNDGKETEHDDGSLPSELVWDDTDLYVTIYDDRSSDEYTSVEDERLSCKHCDAEIVGDRIAEIEG